jgi:cellulose synthase/poly-beta-1,6-N-acetylglucosamine synthase-like glycosyltransferase
VAARNEESGILATLDSLDKLNYPKGLLEIIIGDDRSTDNTAAVVQQFIQGRPHFRYHYCAAQFPGIYAKQNVLAQLSQLAHNEIILHVDADIKVNPDWAAIHVGAYIQHPKLGICSGPTLVQSKRLFARLQSLDWVQAIAHIKTMNQLGLDMTALGNNLSMRKEAYAATGGYEHLPFSITEDLLMMKAIRKRGYELLWLWHPEVMNQTQAPKGLVGYLNQRKRWFKGGMGSPWFAHIIFGIHASLYPILLSSWAMNVLTAGEILQLAGIKILIDYLLLTRALFTLDRLRDTILLPLFTVYNFLQVMVMVIYFPLPMRYNWKGRSFR